MIGQKRLVSRLMSYNISSFPHSCAFIGPKGCGKHMLARDVASHLGLSLDDISDKISLDTIDEIYTTAGTYMYLVDMTSMMERQQNIILKFLEEPLNNTYIIILAEGKSCLIPTVANRCVEFEFEPYTKDELKQFLPKDSSDEILDLCQTPGQVVQASHQDIKALKELCLSVVTKMNKACYPNALSIAKKLNYKDEYDKYDVTMFLNTLTNTILEHIKSPERSVSDIEMMRSVSKCKRELEEDPRLNKENRVTTCISELWDISRKNR
jgi:DNA polymerase III delta prime subunit